MDYKEAYVLDKPNIINWVEKPRSLGESEYIELLKRSVLLQSHSGEFKYLKKLNEALNENSVCFFNLDRILFKNSIPRNEYKNFVKHFIPIVSDFFSSRALVHTNIIDERLGDMFRENGIAYIERNLEDKNKAYSTTLDMVRPFFSLNNKILRTFIRVNLEKLKYFVKIVNHGKRWIPVEGYVKDLSLNGTGIVLNKEKDLDIFNIKDQVSLIMHIKQYFLQIKIGIITRVNRKNQELGIAFDINNKKMVGPMVSDNLSKLIYSYIENIFLHNNPNYKM